MTVTDNNLFLTEYVYYKDPNGVLYPLFGGTRALISWEGVGAPPLNYLSDKGPNTHGINIRDFRYQERRITLEAYERGKLRSDWFKALYDLIDATRPNRTNTNAKSYLLFITPDYIEREIEARIELGPDGNWIGTGSKSPHDMRDRLTFLSGDPFFRDPTQNSTTFSIDPTGACLATC